jgi:DNA-binding transcriptional MerR regulator
MAIPLTTNEVGRRLGVEPWKIRRLYQRGLMPPTERIGIYRAIPVEDLPKIEAALRLAGYLKSEAATV